MKKKILITGRTGFICQNLQKFLGNDFEVETISLRYQKDQILSIDKSFDIVIHTAGMAHDLKNSKSLNDYLESNFELTKQLYSAFLKSNAKKFLFFSSVKAVADSIENKLDLTKVPNPKTHYGISKRKAEEFIIKQNNKNKIFYILRPCMIHGDGNKGNLNLLFNIIDAGIPWILGAFRNSRSFLSIDNLNFIVRELLIGDIRSGLYFLSDSNPISTNSIVRRIGASVSKRIIILKIPKIIVKFFAIIGDFLKLPINSERLKKLTESYVVDNSNILQAINKKLPLTTEEGLDKTFKTLIK